MKILPLQSATCNINFRSECGWDDDDSEYTMDARQGRISGPFQSSKTHPIWVELDFHNNGKISNVKIKYKNGKYASGIIKESYDKNGKNINYCA